MLRSGAVAVARAHAQLWTVDEVAQRLNVTERWVRNAVYLRTIPFIKVGRLLRFDPAAIDKWLADRAEGGGQ